MSKARSLVAELAPAGVTAAGFGANVSAKFGPVAGHAAWKLASSGTARTAYGLGGLGLLGAGIASWGALGIEGIQAARGTPAHERFLQDPWTSISYGISAATPDWLENSVGGLARWGGMRLGGMLAPLGHAAAAIGNFGYEQAGAGDYFRYRQSNADLERLSNLTANQIAQRTTGRGMLQSMLDQDKQSLDARYVQAKRSEQGVGHIRHDVEQTYEGKVRAFSALPRWEQRKQAQLDARAIKDAKSLTDEDLLGISTNAIASNAARKRLRQNNCGEGKRQSRNTVACMRAKRGTLEGKIL